MHTSTFGLKTTKTKKKKKKKKKKTLETIWKQEEKP
jgi:hypothetical protein